MRKVTYSPNWKTEQQVVPVDHHNGIGYDLIQDMIARLDPNHTSDFSKGFITGGRNITFKAVKH